MRTIIFIHGGESFENHAEYLQWIETTAVAWSLDPYSVKTEKKKWKTEIARALTEAGDIVYLPNFPNAQNAKYSEWRLFFDTWIPQIQLSDELILIGNSLGGCFLLRYFSENPGLLSLDTIKSIHLIAACISAGDFAAPENYDSLNELGDRVHIWHTEDDLVVPYETGKALAHILPRAVTHFFSGESGYGHFAGIERLPELESILQK